MAQDFPELLVRGDNVTVNLGQGILQNTIRSSDTESQSVGQDWQHSSDHSTQLIVSKANDLRPLSVFSLLIGVVINGTKKVLHVFRINERRFAVRGVPNAF